MVGRGIGATLSTALGSANEAKCVGRGTRPTRGFAYAWPARQHRPLARWVLIVRGQWRAPDSSLASTVPLDG
jgi:hypothetical protein